jgi:TRAP-type uncharacterized transport system substrate-binding protein
MLERREPFSEDSMIPFHSPFDSKFIHNNRRKYTVDIVKGSHEHDMATLLFPNERIVMTRSHWEELNKVDEYKVDFGFVVEDILHDAVYGINFFEGKKHKNLRFIASLFDATVNIIVPNNSTIVDIMDIKKQKCTIRVNVGHYHSEHHLSCIEVFEYLGITIGKGKDVIFTFHEDEDIAQKYENKEVDMIYHVSHHPDNVIIESSNRIPSHFVSIRSLNTGHMYNYNPQERSFYDNYQNYRKEVHDIQRLLPRMYPKISNIDHTRLYIPTIKTSIILVTHDKIPNNEIKRILNNIKGFLNSIDKVPPKLKFLSEKDPMFLADLSVPIPFHEGAKEFYKNQNIQLTKDTSHCIEYKTGFCPNLKPNLKAE